MTDIELIKSKLDIVEVVSTYIADLKKAGSNYKANCPFHSEKSASFMVNPSLQIYKCFGCGKGGDVINFIQEIERLDFPEAMKLSAEKANVELNNSFSSEKSKKEQAEKQKIIEANTHAAKFYNYILSTHVTGKKGRDYATKRGINAEGVKKFMMGYAPNSKDNLKNFLLKKGFKEKDLIKWGLLVERNGSTIDKFRHRLMHPIFNIKGEVIGFSGRYIGTSKEAPKYLNSPETLVYKKNENLYGLFQAKESMRKENFVIVEEGNVDILSSHRVGIENIVAPLGTAFTENQAKLLKRFVEEFYFCFDTDKAGLNALIKSIGIAENLGIKHRVINVNPFKDPDELIMSEPDEWKNRISNSVNSFEYLIELFAKDYDLNNLDHKLSYINSLKPIFKLINDRIKFDLYTDQVSMRTNISFDKLIKIFNTNAHAKESNNSIEILDSEVKSYLNKINQLETYFLNLLVTSNKIKDLTIPLDYFENTVVRNLYKKLIDNKEEDIAAIYDELDGEEKELFGQIYTFDNTKIEDIEREIDRTMVRLKEFYFIRLNNKIKIENTLGDPLEKLNMIQEMLNEKRSISKKSKSQK